MGRLGWVPENLVESRRLIEQARDAALSEIWRCGCGWSGPRSALKEDYYGTTEVPGGSRFCDTVCPSCGEWLEAVAQREARP